MIALSYPIHFGGTLTGSTPRGAYHIRMRYRIALRAVSGTDAPYAP